MADNRHEVVGGVTCEDIVHRMYYLDQLLINVLRQYFSRPAQNLIPALSHLQWVADSADGAAVNSPTALRIEQWATWNPANADNVPAVIIRPNDIGFSKIGIANRHASPAVHFQGSDEFYTKVAAGSHRIMAVSRSANEAHLMAISIADHLQSFSQQIRRVIQLDACEVSQVGSPRKFRELPHTFASPVNLEYGFFQTWSITPAAPRLNRVRFVTDVKA